jgi:serine/threonine protein kinase
MSAPLSARLVGRYMIHETIAAGGMATVHFGRLVGPVGFTRTVAIKRLHPQFAQDPEFVAMFIDEARLAARIRHPNVVQTIDVVASGSEVFLVMDYVQGEPLSRLRRFATERERGIPLRVVTSILCGVLHGLHAAHEAKSDQGKSLDIVHRDVSPQNILVGTDGIPRVLDFGVAKALGRAHITRDGQLKGKLTYMAPEQLEGNVTRRTDVFAASIVLWETLTGQRLFSGQDEGEVIGKIVGKAMQAPSKLIQAKDRGPIDQAGLDRLDAVTLRGLARRPEDRFETAREMALALEACFGVASPTEVGQWVDETASGVLDERARRVAEIESSTSSRGPGSVPQPSVRAGDAVTVADPRPVQAQPETPVEQGSQASSISLSSHTPARRPHSWTTSAAVAGVAILAIAIGLAALRAERSASPARPPAVAVAATTPLSPPAPPPPASAASAAPAAAAPATLPPAVPSSSALPSSSAAVEVPPTGGPSAATPRTSSKKSGVVNAPSAVVGTSKPDCSTPYTIDTDGRKHFKEECFH